MSDLNQRLMESANGGRKINPDELRHFLGTYAERVLLTVSAQDARTEIVKENFQDILNDLKEKYTPVKVKLSPALSDSLQMTYLKLTKDQELTCTIVEEMVSHVDFGIMVFTDHAVNIEDTDIHTLYPDIFKQEKTETKSEKKGFWSKLFGN
ncbi:DUF1694 domain-containing protein [Streptococcus loxodontisalivarius]|uniref:Uncharacterized protein YueI n=1 Tax=Streptococcus loxodontisalivarius TaxID=1349415 RepID=A0ABS2PTU7_9STRE|nr:DUF1694 domain-containing protein [Streptococcus loxodontisalivarius]MBM7643296.1 uncharacterized protein YueI [Streptococcus loxodontisalivarius]